MNTTTAKISRDGKELTKIYSAVEYRGYLAQIYEKGIGEPIQKAAINAYGEGEEWEEYKSYVKAYRPFFNSSTFSNPKEMEQIKKDLQGKTVDEIIGTVYEKHLVRWGINDGGLLVEDLDKIKKAEFDSKIKEEGFSFELTKKTVDEGEDGPETCFHYSVTHIATGKMYGFTDRNIFDFGRVVNPAYRTHPEWSEGGIAMKNESGEMVWKNCTKMDDTFVGWQEVRKIEDIELAAYNLVMKYGSAARGIRL